MIAVSLNGKKDETIKIEIDLKSIGFNDGKLNYSQRIEAKRETLTRCRSLYSVSEANIEELNRSLVFSKNVAIDGVILSQWNSTYFIFDKSEKFAIKNFIDCFSRDIFSNQILSNVESLDDRMAESLSDQIEKYKILKIDRHRLIRIFNSDEFHLVAYSKSIDSDILAKDFLRRVEEFALSVNPDKLFFKSTDQDKDDKGFRAMYQSYFLSKYKKIYEIVAESRQKKISRIDVIEGIKSIDKIFTVLRIYLRECDSKKILSPRQKIQFTNLYKECVSLFLINGKI